MTESVHAWRPDVPALREAYHARFDHTYPMHTHDDWTVLLVDDGAVEFGIDRHDHLATAAGVTLLPPGVPHDGHSAVEGRSYRKRVLYLEPDWLPATAQGPAAGHPTLTGPEPLAAVRRIHAALREPGDLMAAEHWLLTLRDHTLDRLGAPARTTPDAPLARRLRDMLDDRLTESFAIAEAASRLGAHPSHLTRTFTRTFGIAPHQYQIGRRVDRARRLLVYGNRPAAVAVLAGFHDQAHLTRHFRRVLGVAPASIAAPAPSAQ